MLNQIKTKFFENISAGFLALIFLSAPVLFLSCDSGQQGKTVKKPNIIFIVTDALRADHLHCYGYSKKTSPHIDRLAKDGVLFKTCVTAINRTLPSAVTLFTGLYPHSHGTRSNFSEGHSHNAAQNVNLSEILSQEGYTTAAIVKQELLTAEAGYSQGFQSYQNVERDHRVTAHGIHWLESKRGQDKPVFLLLWYFASHWPYDPPPEDLDRFAKDKDLDIHKLLERDSNDVRIFGNIYNPREADFLRNAYDASVYAVDREIGKVINYLKESRLYEDAIVVFVSDHGEGLGSHGEYFEHGEFFYDDTALVPFIIKKSRKKKPVTVNDQVRTVDIFPTLLSMLGIKQPSEGEDLLTKDKLKKEKLKSLLAFGETDYLLFENNPKRYVPGAAGKWRIVRSNRWKLIFIPHPEENIFEFYDIRNDPSETKNLIHDPNVKGIIENFKKELFSWIKKEDLADQRMLSKDDLPQDEKLRLKSLGYL